MAAGGESRYLSRLELRGIQAWKKEKSIVRVNRILILFMEKKRSDRIARHG